MPSPSIGVRCSRTGRGPVLAARKSLWDTELVVWQLTAAAMVGLRAPVAPRRQIASGTTGHPAFGGTVQRTGISMTKLFGYAGSVVGSTLGWWVGALFGTMTAFLLSIVGTGVGIYVGRLIAAEYE